MTQRWLGPLLKLFGTNWITLFGANVTTISAVVILGFLLLGLVADVDNPYIAMMVLLVLPAIFVGGLLLIPLGLWVEKRRKLKHPDEDREGKRFPIIDLNRSRVRHIAMGVGVLTTFNFFLIGIVSYKGVNYMDSTEFCGEVCHTVMQPEYTAYQGSPHSRVECVECHIGPGAPWFVRSKLSGLYQVVAVTLDTYPTPIPTPVENLRPSQDICEQCHWPGRFTGDRVDVRTDYSEDETNSALKTVLLMHIGGGDREEGIHSWHIQPGRETYYWASDHQRQEIPWVQVVENGEVTEFVSDPELIEGVDLEAEKRRMDCIDCHNRPTHAYKLPGEAVDEALLHGRISPSIPFIKQVGTEALEEVGESLGPSEQVVQRVRDYYQENHADLYNSQRARIESAVQEIRDIYERNVFPHMQVTWGTYPNNIGHEDFPGCFRCHDGGHESADGAVIDQDCSSCHTILAWGEPDPEILDQLELE